MADQPFRAVAVLGLGAMGGSLARALSRLEAPPTVAGWSPSAEERAAALEAGAVGRAPDDWREAVGGADLVVLAAPLEACRAMLGDVAQATSSETTLSDVASLKGPLVRAAAEAGARDRWVGSHPMAGTDQSGFAASRHDLYEGATVWTVADPAAAERVEPVHRLWRAVRALPAEIDAEEHDRLMALASHLPQLTSNALAEVLANGGVAPDRLGPGGRDMTRLAGSSPELWRDIFRHASPELTRGLRTLSDAASQIADHLETGDLEAIEQLMDATRAWRRPE